MAIKINKGFTIFFAVLVASLALSVGLVIYDLLNRSLSLSQVATQSQYAIYAADTGAECALYWDLKYSSLVPGDIDGSAFATSSVENSNDTALGINAVTCNTQGISVASAILSAQQPGNWAVSPVTATAATTTFWFSMGSAASTSCVKVEVGKSGNPSQTSIISHGYSTCATVAPLRLERTLQINY